MCDGTVTNHATLDKQQIRSRAKGRIVALRQRATARRRSKNSHRRSVAASVAALGIVFGDIGTSPLYAVKELMFKSGASHSPEASIGAISLVIWLLTIVVCFKYVMIVLRADNEEQGGVFALLALLSRHKKKSIALFTSVLVFAAGMLLGDGVITPAISVLSAVEGLSVASPDFRHYTVPITLAILAALFAFQRFGTDRVGRLFGPIMIVWFGFLALTGLHGIAAAPRILEAANPIHAIEFLGGLGLHQLTLAIGSVILVVTGGEALFADLGHLGKRPIRISWFAVVYPALVLNYLGQGAHLLSGQKVVDENIFFSMVPSWSLYPAVALATVATVIASQALISGAFSLVSQGIALKYLPTMHVIHTHDEREGQLYIPNVNWALFIGATFLVVTFRSSTHLASAYGLAVASDMVVTTIAVAAVARWHWKWRMSSVAMVFIPLGVVDGSLLLGNLSKIPTGGYVPLVIGGVMVTIMLTWRWGRERVRLAFMELSTMHMSEILHIWRRSDTPLFPRPVVLLTAYSPRTVDDQVPPLLEIFYKRYGALPKHLVLLSIEQTRVPYVLEDERYDTIAFDHSFDVGTSLLSVRAAFGFRESPDVEDVIDDIVTHVIGRPGETITSWGIFAAKERIVGARDSGWLQRGRHELFKAVRRQAEPAYFYFGLDDDSRLTVELIPVVI